MTQWLDVSEITILIGVSDLGAAAETLDQAAAIVEAFINREVEDILNISARDLRRIKKAISWQALYLADQPDFNYLTLVDSTTADGQTFNMAKQGLNGSVFEAAQVLHPLAIRELRNLSWKRGHLNLAKKRWHLDLANDSFLNEASDDEHSWKELS